MHHRSCPSRVRSLALALLTCSALACSAEAEPDPDARVGEATACGGYELTPCDILDPACQQRIAEIAACQWGGPGTPALLPEVNTVSEQDYRNLLTQATPPQEATRTAVAEVLALLGLIDQEDLSVEAVVNRSAEIVAAFYDFDAKTINLIEREEAADFVQSDGVLLHELIHVQQDAAHDLAALHSQFPRSTDGLAALQGLYEGEATFHQLLFDAALRRVPLSSALLELNLRRRREAVENELFMGPSVFSSSLQVLPYIYGPVWMYELWVDGGSAAVQDRYDDPPPHLLSVLQSSWRAPAETPRVTEYPGTNVFYTGAPPAEDSELVPVGFDRLGAYSVYIAARLAGDAQAGEQLALGWRGDQLDVYGLDAGGAAGRWRLSFDSAAHAQAFSELMAQNPNVTVRRSGRAVACVVSGSGDKPEWLFGPLAAI